MEDCWRFLFLKIPQPNSPPPTMKPLLLPAVAASLCAPAMASPPEPEWIEPDPFVTDLEWFEQWQEPVHIELEEEDLAEVARSLGVDVATIHAVIDIEAGRAHQGFWSEGKPVICFSPNLFKTYAQRRGIKLSKYAKSHAVVFAPANKARYGSHQAAHQAQLDAAMEIDEVTAIESTFWGMFQIGGFNWRKCGVDSPHEFVEKMQRSERDQLDLFVNFLRSTGLDKPLQAHNWTAFARGYNGRSYAKHGYHKRLAQSYKRYK